MKEGTVVQWYKNEGDTVAKGEPLVEVVSEKVIYEVEAPTDGVLRKILAKDGTDAPVAGTLGLITAPDEELADLAPAPSSPEKIVEEPTVFETQRSRKAERRVPASPAAKRLAKEHDVDLSQVQGTGPEGRIVEADVQRIVDVKVGKPLVQDVIPLTGIRRTSANRVSLSVHRAPQSTITMEVDMSNAQSLRESVGVSYTDMIVKAVALALMEHPLMNSTLDTDEIKTYAAVNVGVAVATERGLTVPVIRNANEKSLSELAVMLKDLVKKARQGKLSRRDLTGGTFTITNLGMYGVDVFTPIINPPETAILGVGQIVNRPVVIEKEIGIRPIVVLSLTFDHRVVDGVPAATFLQNVKAKLETPNLLTS